MPYLTLGKRNEPRPGGTMNPTIETIETAMRESRRDGNPLTDEATRGGMMNDNTTRRYVGPPRYRVRYEGERGSTSVVTLANRPPQVVTAKIIGRIVVFRDQEHGNTYILGRDIVTEVVIEECDRYGDWHRTGTIDLESTGA
jgi:hypothetical protein